MTRLYFVDANHIVGAEDLGVILLADKDGARGISIVCERNIVNQLLLRKNEKVDTKRWLPEVLWTTIRRNVEGQFRIMFSNMQEEEYVVFLYDEQRSTAQAIRASDGVLLALVASIPIFIDDRLFMRQSVALDKNTNGIRIPINSLSTTMLKEALQHAIDEEQFEHASHIRDELRRREQTMETESGATAKDNGSEEDSGSKEKKKDGEVNV